MKLSIKLSINYRYPLLVRIAADTPGGAGRARRVPFRVVKPFVYKRKTTNLGTVYEAGKTRMVDATMDGDMLGRTHN